MANNQTEKLVHQAKIAMQERGLYVATKSDIQKLADVSADAYYEYPLHEWFCNGKYSEQVAKDIMKTTLLSVWKKCIVYADSPDINGFAVWMPPCYSGCKTIPYLFAGGLKVLFRHGVGLTSRMMYYENLAMRIKKEITNHQDWYAFNLSVKRSEQGKGIARKLFQPMMDFVESQHGICYLETNKASNVTLYQHFGFTLEKECKIKDSDVNHYAFVKRPSNQ